MSYYFKNIRPELDNGSSEDEYADEPLPPVRSSRAEYAMDSESSDEELKTLSFGSLKSADAAMAEEDKMRRLPKAQPKHVKRRKTEQKQPKLYQEESFSNSSENSSEEGFFEEDSRNCSKSSHNEDRVSGKNKKRKHAPTEHSFKKKVSFIRDIPGLQVKAPKSGLYQDIRFDKSVGEADNINAIRKRYAFLDEYRQKEIEDLELKLKDRKFVNKLEDFQVQEMQDTLKSTKSRLQSIKNKDLERTIIKDYEAKINENNKTRYRLKDSEKRKVIQKWKFDHMKSKQREKVMERKRKKRLGKEFKQFEFHKK